MCFVTKQTPTESILGVGISVTKNMETNRLELNCNFDLISKTAFYNLGVRQTAFKEEINFFLPCAINKNHFQLALEDLKTSLAFMNTDRIQNATKTSGTQAKGESVHALN